ncbi:hypothetical protein BST61_g7598 [Cercospora zeina]
MASLWSVILWSLTWQAAHVSCFRLWDNTTEVQLTFPKVYIKDDQNLYMSDAAGVETALSTDATEITAFVPETVHKSQDGKYAVAYRIGSYGQNHSLTLIESSPPDQLQPSVLMYPYPKAGDLIPILRPKLYDLVEKKEIEIGNDFVGNVAEIDDVQWGFRNQTYRYIVVDRGFKDLRMVEIDTSGNSRILVEEHIENGIDISSKIAWGFMNETDQMWWLSERNGWNSVYLVNTTRVEGSDRPSNDSIKQITADGFDVYEVAHVDEQEQVLYVRARGMVKNQSPYHMHLARINFDGTGFKILTADGDGYHRHVFHDNGTFDDTWSRVDQPLQGVLRDYQGNRLHPIEVDNKVYFNITLPEIFSAPGRDGETPIWGIITKPTTFDATKRYRVMEFVYAVPQEHWVPVELTMTSMAELSLHYQQVADKYDVIVVQSDGMGTSWRGRAFRDVAWYNFREAGFPDRIAWIKAAAQDRPWMDLAGGVGIFGGSAGGQTAMAALIWYSEFYTAAMADAGCHENRMDKFWWNELNLGYPVDDAKYDAASNLVHAHEMNGTLLLLVGELDHNVDPSSTMQVVNALNKAGKDFDFMIVPGAGHGVAFSQWYPQLQNKIGKFWKNWKDGNGLA